MTSYVARLRPREHRAERIGPADHVHVDVLHFLAADAAGIDDRPEAVGRALLAREPPGERQHPAQRGRVLVGRVVQRRDVLLRDDMKCTGASGWMSWNARMSSSS